MSQQPCDGPAVCPPENAPPPTPLEKLLRALSVVTMLMTVPQVWSVWVDRETGGVSVLTWLTYTFSAIVWFIYGLQKRDKTIYLACIGWIILDLAIVLGVLVRR